MTKVFQPYLRKFVLVFFDDILVYSRLLDQHLEHLSVVLADLRRNHLYAKKCLFAQAQVEYLGHIVYVEGVATDRSKVAAKLDWSVPQNIKELQGFLGLIGYFWKFVQLYSTITWPLTKQLKKDHFS